MAALFVVAACASPPKDDPEALAEYQALNDPAEPTNRAIFSFNRGVDKYVLKPVTRGYRAIAPDTVRRGVHNFLNNLRTPVILFNDLMQAEFKRAGTTVARFFINSTIGIAGFSDQAANFGFEFHDEDFGQTLAVWTVPEGPYLMVPVLGPSNPRDLAGIVVDFFVDPLNWWAANTHREWITYTRTAVTAIDTRDQLWDVLEDLEQNSVDFYAALRSMYRQRRNDEIRNGEGSEVRPAPGLTSIDEDEFSISTSDKEAPARK
jgi:phospholipid-binding lipoprotein MlaA